MNGTTFILSPGHQGVDLGGSNSIGRSGGYTVASAAARSCNLSFVLSDLPSS